MPVFQRRGAEPVPEHASDRMSLSTRELAVRVASAVVLGTATLLVTWRGGVAFAILVACVAAVLIWEWGRLLRGAGIDALTTAGAAGVIAAIALVAAGWPEAGLAALGATVVAMLAMGRLTGGLVEAGGVLYAGLPSLALVWLRSAPEYGLEAILLILLVVWATDTGAYIFGRTIGGPKLCAQVSPNKTWAGLLGGVAAATTGAWLFAIWLGSLAPGRVAVLATVLAILSQIGDLVESAIKRARGVKDASHLIPGHGGFMDRVDGLVFAATAAAVYAALVDAAVPGSALLWLR